MLNNSVNMREPSALRVASFHDAGQARYDRHHVTKILTRSVDVRINVLTPRAVVCQLESVVVFRIHHHSIGGIINASAMLLRPGIADNEIDRDINSQGNGNADASSRTVAVRSPELDRDRQVSGRHSSGVFRDNAGHLD